jgi:hypothetical protein
LQLAVPGAQQQSCGIDQQLVPYAALEKLLTLSL